MVRIGECRYIGQVGKWKEVGSERLNCIDACKRQENKIFTSESSFPSRVGASHIEWLTLKRMISGFPRFQRILPCSAQALVVLLTIEKQEQVSIEHIKTRMES